MHGTWLYAWITVWLLVWLFGAMVLVLPKPDISILLTTHGLNTCIGYFKLQNVVYQTTKGFSVSSAPYLSDCRKPACSLLSFEQTGNMFQLDKIIFVNDKIGNTIYNF